MEEIGDSHFGIVPPLHSFEPRILQQWLPRRSKREKMDSSKELKIVQKYFPGSNLDI